MLENHSSKLTLWSQFYNRYSKMIPNEDDVSENHLEI